LRQNRITQLRDRHLYSFGKGRIGPWWGVRVILLLVLAAAATWYGRQGVNNPFTGRTLLSVFGDGDGFTVACIKGRTPHIVSEFIVSPSGNDWREDRRNTSESSAKINDIRPFADSVTAVLLTFAKSDILICDSSAFDPRPAGTRSSFWEKAELLIIPPASEAEIMEVRDRFRPRLLAVVPPCNIRSTQNVICRETDAKGAFRYDFEIRRGILRLTAEHEPAK